MALVKTVIGEMTAVTRPRRGRPHIAVRLHERLQMIRLFTSKWNGRHDCLQTTAEHYIVWSIWAGNRSKLSARTWTRNASFTWNLTNCLVRFWLFLLTEYDRCFQVLNSSRNSLIILPVPYPFDSDFWLELHLTVKFSWFYIIFTDI